MILFIYGLINLLIGTIECLEYILIAYIIMGWFVIFGVIKNQESPVFRVYIFLMSKIEPVLSIVRRHIPSAFGLDFSAIVVFFILYLLKVFVIQLAILLT